ncbi:hypothetical protein RHSIM_Rhsim13G0011800 [Rhododendron simsii]|uniref:Flotillin-like n=1 Tax=Rhododendron simsii TaxID=118357 RepID=A0A834L6D8_RHOSS|nr:hypothetical protein RHSIM_Rhsim13G0011800 [Rhododendron simsii]
MTSSRTTSSSSSRASSKAMIMEKIFKGIKEFKKEVFDKVQLELDQFGLHIYNANVKQLVDVPGHEYFSYLGQKIQMEAANQARVLKECLIVQAGKYNELLQAGTNFKALVLVHHEAIESMDILINSFEDSDGCNPCDASIVFNKRCDSIGNNIVSLVKEVKEDLSAHKLAAIKTTWLPSVLLADAYPLQFAYVCTQQMSFNQNTLNFKDSDLVFVAVRNSDDFRLLVLGANGSEKMYD